MKKKYFAFICITVILLQLLNYIFFKGDLISVIVTTLGIILILFSVYSAKIKK